MNLPGSLCWAQAKLTHIQVLSEGDVDQALVVQALGLNEGEVFSLRRADKGLVRIAELGRFKFVEGDFDPATGNFQIRLKLVETLAGIDVLVKDRSTSESLSPM